MSPNLKILVADDDPDHVRLITEILNQELKAEVESVAKGKECLKKVIKNRYDLLLLDYLFPDISGLDILKQIAEKGTDLPIIMISGHGTEKVAVAAMKAGAIDYIIKSEDGFQSLPFAAKRAIEKDQLRKKLRQSEEKFKNLFESAHDAIIYLDRTGRILEANKQVVEVFGVSKPEVLGKQLIRLDIFPPREIPAFLNSFADILAGREVTQDICIKNKKGQEIVLECSTSLTKTDDKVTGVVFIARNITERKKAEEEIRRKAKELQEKNDELTRFTYAVSHDLRSPLVTVQTFQGHLERDIRSRDAARVEKDLGYIRNAADKMGRLLDDLRRFSRVGRIINPSEEAPLQAIVKEALDLVAGRITGRGVRIDLTEEPVVLYGDRTRLVEVFLNLVDNAVKFMGDQPAPRVEIGVEEAGEELVLHVRDNGIGIDPELQPLVFGLFHKLDPGSEGEGIGLALAKRIVELHGGRIWVESEGLGKGTMFRFTLANMRRGVGREERT